MAASSGKVVDLMRNIIAAGVKSNTFNRVLKGMLGTDKKILPLASLNGALAWIGVETLRKGMELMVTHGEPGRCVCEIKVCEEHTNSSGTLHGGFTATLVDIVSTTALFTTAISARGSSVDLNITYIRPVKIGEEIIIDAKTLRSGRSLAFLTVDIMNKKDGSLVAQARHTKFIPKKEPPIPETNELYYLVF